MQQGTNIPITGALYEDDALVEDLSEYGIDVLVVCADNGEKVYFSSRQVHKEGDVTISGSSFAFELTPYMSAQLSGKCYAEIRVFKNGDCFIGADRQERVYFSIKTNEIHKIWN